ncbi:MAG: Spy0128 family protein [Eggerthellaceae bacterium]|jgi:pilin isopeptide linkage protein
MVTKQWNGFAAPSAKVHLLADGHEVDSATLTATNGWTHTFSVDAVTAEGADIDYTVTEDAIKHYTSKVTGSESDGFTITNSYEGLTVDDPPVKKNISGDKPKKASAFTFTFAAEPDKSTLPAGMASNEMPMPEGANGQSMTTTVKGEGSSEFGTLKFYQPGTYVYKITEDNDGVSGYTYDDSVYEVTYQVSEKHDELVSHRTITKNGKAISTATFKFTNIYNANEKNPDNDNNGATDKKDSDSGNDSVASKGTYGSSGNGAGSAAVDSVQMMPVTGDNAGPLVIALVAICIAAAIGIFAAIRKRRKNK